MNKTHILALVLDKLRQEMESRRKVSRLTREQGNDPESQAKSKYDTLSIEENYLADGLAQMALSSAQAIEALEGLKLHDFAEDEAISLGALVELEFSEAREWFFLAPSGGGTEVTLDGSEITVITPESPLGSQLLGARPGARIKAPAARVKSVF
ncbi:MAG: hypothetical protein WEB60_03135 [Terrimicrobiaceae bacterium]